jgi:integrase/recombinase XerD
VRFLERFMTFRFGAKLGDLNDITPADIVKFLREVMGRKTPYRDKTPPTHLRSLFRYLFWSGKTKRDLASSLPRVATGRASHLSRSLKPEEIERLIDAGLGAGRCRATQLRDADGSGAPRLARI